MRYPSTAWATLPFNTRNNIRVRVSVVVASGRKPQKPVVQELAENKRRRLIGGSGGGGSSSSSVTDS